MRIDPSSGSDRTDKADDFLAKSHSRTQDPGVRFEGWRGLPKINQASPREAGHKPAFLMPERYALTCSPLQMGRVQTAILRDSVAPGRGATPVDGWPVSRTDVIFGSLYEPNSIFNRLIPVLLSR
ncbi:hypothetical protein F7R14_20305 [Pseudomonas lini]|uniref:Uncharacterized protein n=1 Tax=Pseudomonas lini TaxID=163011 RepID=A0A7V7TKK2_9PSED|nr:hypothetical protein F7R14_20305 [Pseudomonas lini]